MPPAARTVTLEVLAGVSANAQWKARAEAATTADGQVVWKLTLKPGTYRVRARWAGSSDLAGALSQTLVLRVT